MATERANERQRWLTRQFTTRNGAFPGIVSRVVEKPERVEWLIGGVDSVDPAIKYGCAKALKLLAEAEPRLMYRHFDYFVGQLDNPKGPLRWNAAAALAGLAAVDRANKLDSILDRYLGAIDGPELIDAATAIQGAARIARGKPKLAAQCVIAILRVSGARYKTDECRNVAAGHAIQALADCLDLVENKAPVIAFVKMQVENMRPGTRKKAEAFLRKHAGTGSKATPTTRRRASP